MEDAPIDKVDTSRSVDESSIDVELPSDTPVERADKSPAPTNGADAEETGTGDHPGNPAPVTQHAPRSAGLPTAHSDARQPQEYGPGRREHRLDRTEFASDSASA